MKLSIITSGLIITTFAFASQNDYSVILPSVEVEGISEQNNLKGYVTYDSSDIARNGLTNKETPQTIQVIDIVKNKNYGTNDLSSILEGNAGINAGYDMRGESINLRGFSIDSGDIYRDGVRDSGQIRRSTANVERVEILKGPASILYGRSQGGGVVNLVSKKANFTPVYHLSTRYGSWDRYGFSSDLNHAFNSQIAARLTADFERGGSWRDDVKYKNFMLSPSVLVTNKDGDVSFEAQYTHDNAWRVPDRTPEKSVYDALGLNYKKNFSHKGDFVRDVLDFFRTELNAKLINDINLKWVFGYREASQNFDHFFGGSIVNNNQIKQNYAKQETKNSTISNSITLTKELEFERFKHNFTFGYDNSIEKREPKLWYNRNFTATINPYASSFDTPRYDTLTTYNKHKAINNGIFFDDLISFDDKYKILLGGRFDFYKFSTDNQINGVNNSYKGDTFSPRIGLLWDFLPEHTAYVSYSKSFSPYGGRGMISVGDIDKADIKPQTNHQYEFGFKSNWADNKFSSDLAFFYIEHKNIMYQPDSKNDPYTWSQRGKEISKGVELNILGQVYENLYLRSSVGYLLTKIDGDKASPLRDGKPLNDTTKWQGNVFLRYVNSNVWYVESGVTAYSKRYNYGSNGTSENHLPGFARLDMSGGYNFNKNTQITLAVNNVLNKKYWRSSARAGDERSFMLNLHYNF